MLVPHRLRQLTLDAAAHPRGQPHLSSASGLVRVGNLLYIVADDEHHLAQLDAGDVVASPLRLVRFASADLPKDPVRRKAAKPDLETLIHFPAAGAGEGRLLVAWGSASRPARERAFVFGVDADGALTGDPRELSTAALCAQVRAHFDELNFEAGFLQGGRLHLFHRANAGQPLNGHMTFDRAAVRDWLTGRTADVPALLAFDKMDLGTIAGVPLGITDAAALPDGSWVFCAVAEDTTDAYNDGACVGSVIGRADDQGRVLQCESLQGAPKVEGVALAGDDRLWLVTDADDPGRASELLEVRLRF